MISYRCPFCKSRHDAQDGSGGTIISCPTCSRRITVPRTFDVVILPEDGIEPVTPMTWLAIAASIISGAAGIMVWLPHASWYAVVIAFVGMGMAVSSFFVAKYQRILNPLIIAAFAACVAIFVVIGAFTFVTYVSYLERAGAFRVVN